MSTQHDFKTDRCKERIEFITLYIIYYSLLYVYKYNMVVYLIIINKILI